MQHNQVQTKIKPTNSNFEQQDNNDQTNKQDQPQEDNSQPNESPQRNRGNSNNDSYVRDNMRRIQSYNYEQNTELNKEYIEDEQSDKNNQSNDKQHHKISDNDTNQKQKSQYLSNYPINQLQLNTQQPKQSPTKPLSKTISQQQISLPYLRIIFDHYSKISYIKGPSMTFERVLHQTQILNINKFMVWCKQFQIVGKVPVMKLMEIFKKSGTSHKELNFDEFMVAIGKMADLMFEGEDRCDEMRKYLGVRDQIDFKNKSKELHISFTKAVASVVIPIHRKQRSSSHLKQQSSQISQTRMARIKSQFLNNKGLNLQKYTQPIKYRLRYKQQSINNLKQRNSQIIRIRQNNSKNRSQLKGSILANHKKQESGRYSRVKNTVEKYKVSTIISQAKIQLQKNSKKEKSSVDNKINKLSKKEEPKANVGLFDKLFGGEQDDEFLKDYERTENIANHKKVSQSLSKRIEQLRMISYKK